MKLLPVKILNDQLTKIKYAEELLNFQNKEKISYENEFKIHEYDLNKYNFSGKDKTWFEKWINQSVEPFKEYIGLLTKWSKMNSGLKEKNGTTFICSSENLLKN